MAHTSKPCLCPPFYHLFSGGLGLRLEPVKAPPGRACETVPYLVLLLC